MKIFNSKNQRGAVLAFSLVMLLLLTLAGVSMIQQNKQQLEMANSGRLLTQKFANAESLLEAAKTAINTTAQHIDPTGVAVNHSSHECLPTVVGGIPMQNISLAGPITGVSNATITSVRCRSYDDDDDEQVCSIYGGSQITCNPNGANPVTNCDSFAKALTAFPTADSSNLCYQAYNPQGTGGGVTQGKCPKEIYTIETISTDSSGTKREVISDHVIGCGS